MDSLVAQWRSIRLLTEGLLVRIQPKEPVYKKAGLRDTVVLPFLSSAQETMRDLSVTQTGKKPPVENSFSGDYWAFIIGIDKYPYLPVLETAVKDARTIKDVLTEKYNFSLGKIIALYDEEATREINSRHTYLVADSCFSGTLFASARTIPLNVDNQDEYVKRMYEKTIRQGLTSGGSEPVTDGSGLFGGHSVFAHYFIKALEENKQQSKSFTCPVTLIGRLLS